MSPDLLRLSGRPFQDPEAGPTRSRSSRRIPFVNWRTSGALVVSVVLGVSVLGASPALADTTPHGEGSGTICNGVASFTWTGSGFLPDATASVRAGKSPYIDDPSILAHGTSDDNGNLTVTATAQVTDGWKPNVAYDWSMGVMGQSGTSNIAQDETGFMLVDCNAPPNNPPQANDDTAKTNVNTAATVNVLANDTDSDTGDTLSVATFDSTSTQGGTVTLVSNELQYTPATDFAGTDTFGYTAGDGKDGSNRATVTVTVNKPPTVTEQSFIVVENSPTDLPVLTAAKDSDGGTLSLTGVTAPSHGTTSVNGTKAHYVPATGYTGPDSFTITVSDGQGGTATGTVNVLVNAPSPIVVTPRKPTVAWGTGRYGAYLYVHCARATGVKYMVGTRDCSGTTIRLKPAQKVTVVPKASHSPYQLNQHYSGWTFVNTTKVVHVGGYAIAGNGKEKIDRLGVSIPKAYRTKVTVKGYINGHAHRLIHGVLYVRVGQTGKIVVLVKGSVHHVVFQNLQRSITAVTHRNRG